MLVFLGAASARGAQEQTEGSEAEQPAAQEAPAPPFPFHGWISVQLRSRWARKDNQHVAYQHLGWDVGDPEQHKVTGHFFGRLLEDIGSQGRDRIFQPFNGLVRVRDRRADARIYSAYLDIHRVAPLDMIRLGRQDIPEIPFFLAFDGARLESRPVPSARENVLVGVYGGIPVRYYASRAEDALAGAYVEVLPWRGGRLRVDAEFVRDERLRTPLNNYLVGVAAGQSITEYLRLDLNYSLLNKRHRDAGGRITVYFPDIDFTAQLSGYELFRTQRAMALEFEPFVSVLRNYFPYRQGTFLVSKGFGPKFWAEAGVTGREVSRHLISPFNRQFWRFHGTVGARDAPAKGIDVSFTGEVWDSRGRRFFTVGAELARRFGQKVRGSIGTEYSLFKYDFLDLQEREQVRTFFARVEAKVRKDLRFECRYELERGREETTHGLRVGLRWTF